MHALLWCAVLCCAPLSSALPRAALLHAPAYQAASGWHAFGPRSRSSAIAAPASSARAASSERRLAGAAGGAALLVWLLLSGLLRAVTAASFVHLMACAALGKGSRHEPATLCSFCCVPLCARIFLRSTRSELACALQRARQNLCFSCRPRAAAAGAHHVRTSGTQRSMLLAELLATSLTLLSISDPGLNRALSVRQIKVNLRQELCGRAADSHAYQLG